MVTSCMWEKTIKKIEDLEQENAKLKAKLHNMDGGLRKAENIMIEGPDIDICPMSVDGEYHFGVVGREGYIFLAPTLAELIVKMGEEE